MTKITKLTPKSKTAPVNIYGRKPSALVVAEAGQPVSTFTSRRQARKARAKEAAALGMQPHQLRVVQNGSQQPDYHTVSSPAKTSRKKAA